MVEHPLNVLFSMIAGNQVLHNNQELNTTAWSKSHVHLQDYNVQLLINVSMFGLSNYKWPAIGCMRKAINDGLVRHARNQIAVNFLAGIVL